MKFRKNVVKMVGQTEWSNNQDEVCSQERSDRNSDSDDKSIFSSASSSGSALQVNGASSKDTREFYQLKCLTVMVLLMSVLGALLVYLYINRMEHRSFENKFYDDANKVLGAVGNSVEKSLTAMDSLALTIMSIAKSSKQQFPFVTVPDYGIHVLKTMPITNAISTAFVSVVTPEQRREYEAYAAGNNTNLPSYVNFTLALQDHWDGFNGPMPQNYSWEYHDVIYGDNGDIPYDVKRDDRLDILLPSWHVFPLIMTSYPPANWDWNSITYPDMITNMMQKRKAVIGPPFMIPRPDNPNAMAESQMWCAYYSDFISKEENCMEPMSQLIYPIIDMGNRVPISEQEGYPDAFEVKGMLAAEFRWRGLIKELLPQSSRGVILVFKNPCVPDAFTYQINGPEVQYLGVGDIHNPKYDGITVGNVIYKLNSYRVENSQYTGLPIDEHFCPFHFQVYPSEELETEFKSNSAVLFAFSAMAFIVFPFVTFLLYDWKVTRQRKQMITTATQSNAIVSSLFPSEVLKKLYDSDIKTNSETRKPLNFGTISNAPIAELYPDVTVIFADIADFTAWSSVRDPLQVFTLLEKIYCAFDEIANRRRIFKVETVGDSYIAVSGLPKPRQDHAVTMAKFAKDIIREMKVRTLELDVILGPDTSSLSIRVGLNSGPTTAGVLRGAKGRFQLFGDTVNIAARMESSSYPGKILCTVQTANLLKAAGKHHWVTERSDLVDAKGKGLLQCYWCNPNNRSTSCTESVGDDTDNQETEIVERPQRIVDWMTDIFSTMLEEVISQRILNNKKLLYPFQPTTMKFLAPRDEVCDIIVLPNIDSSKKSSRNTSLDSKVKEQLQEYVDLIMKMYRNNPFHNFEHACHVVMSTRKLLSRVVRYDNMSVSSTAYGITSDQLTQFAIVFSALIHDLDHPGVSNMQLVQEGSNIAKLYSNKSVAEQNSVTLAWDLLLNSKFCDLREAIMPTESECMLFRQLLVNSVLATDLFDKDLKSLRESRWKTAFPSDITDNKWNESVIDINRRATIVIEHVIQAADVSHTMQHWHIYQKWNRRLLCEMYNAYKTGRAEKDPTLGWYNGELWFFDNYVIPLAKKLKTCGVFGVSCDELLDYAVRNRSEWEVKGQSIVAETVDELTRDTLSKQELVAIEFSRIADLSDSTC